MSTPDEVREHPAQFGHDLGWGPDTCEPCVKAQEEIREARRARRAHAARMNQAVDAALRWAVQRKGPQRGDPRG